MYISEGTFGDNFAKEVYNLLETTHTGVSGVYLDNLSVDMNGVTRYVQLRKSNNSVGDETLNLNIKITVQVLYANGKIVTDDIHTYRVVLDIVGVHPDEIEDRALLKMYELNNKMKTAYTGFNSIKSIAGTNNGHITSDYNDFKNLLLRIRGERQSKEIRGTNMDDIIQKQFREHPNELISLGELYEDNIQMLMSTGLVRYGNKYVYEYPLLNGDKIIMGPTFTYLITKEEEILLLYDILIGDTIEDIRRTLTDFGLDSTSQIVLKLLGGEQDGI